MALIAITEEHRKMLEWLMNNGWSQRALSKELGNAKRHFHLVRQIQKNKRMYPRTHNRLVALYERERK